jgi:hypothetical protein
MRTQLLKEFISAAKEIFENARPREKVTLVLQAGTFALGIFSTMVNPTYGAAAVTAGVGLLTAKSVRIIRNRLKRNRQFEHPRQ